MVQLDLVSIFHNESLLLGYIIKPTLLNMPQAVFL